MDFGVTLAFGETLLVVAKAMSSFDEFMFWYDFFQVVAKETISV